MRRWLRAVLIVGVTSGLAAAGRHLLGLPDVEMFYLLGVVLAALYLGRGPSVLVAALSVVAYDLLFVPPLFTLAVVDKRYFLTFAMMFAIGLVISGLTLRLRHQERAAAEHQARVRTEELRSTLLSSVSHDLRTPLATITGAATTLRDDASLDPATRRDLADAVCEEAERLAQLVSNLLDMTRVDSGGMVAKTEWVPFEEIIGGALERVDAHLAGREVSTRIADALPLVPCDPVLLEQLLINLLENAAKYTPAGTGIEVVAASASAATEAASGAGAIVIEVRDRGPGLPEGDLERIFGRFVRGPHGSVDGAGLGLPICRGIAQAHGGTLVAANHPEGGAIFRVTIPLPGPPPRVDIQDSVT